MLVDLQYDTEQLQPDRYRLQSDILLQSKTGRVFRIPAGFVTDGASVPDLLQGLVHPVYRDFPADAFHDFFYIYNAFSGFTRKDIDAFWLEFMKQFNRKNHVRTYTKYAYVRLLGWYNWNYYHRQARSGKLKPFDESGGFFCVL